MAKAHFKSVDEYIASQPESVRTRLKRVRRIIRTAVPMADEVISYNIPTYKLRGDRLLYFAGWKQHYSLYPASPRMVAAFKNDPQIYKLSKGTIRFPLVAPVPEKLIEQIAKFRAKEIAERAKVAATKKH